MNPDTPKEFGLSTASIRNRTTVAVLIAIILLSGISAYITVPKESFPEVVVPEVYIGTAYPGNSPSDIEKLITRPIEKELKGITGIDEIISTSQQGYSSIDVKFDFSVTPEVGLRKVKDKVDIAMSDPSFPDDLPSDPNIFDLNFTELIPVMQVNLSGDYPVDQLEDYAEELQDRIEDLDQINEAEIRGVNKKEMEVEVDYLRAEAMLVSFNDIAQAIGQDNLSISGGDILMDGRRRTVQVIGDIRDAADLESVIVKAEGGNPVYLRDVATVQFVDREATSFAREWGNPVVSLDVRKRAGRTSSSPPTTSTASSPKPKPNSCRPTSTSASPPTNRTRRAPRSTSSRTASSSASCWWWVCCSSSSACATPSSSGSPSPCRCSSASPSSVPWASPSM